MTVYINDYDKNDDVTVNRNDCDVNRGLNVTDSGNLMLEGLFQISDPSNGTDGVSNYVYFYKIIKL